MKIEDVWHISKENDLMFLKQMLNCVMSVGKKIIKSI